MAGAEEISGLTGVELKERLLCTFSLIIVARRNFLHRCRIVTFHEFKSVIIIILIL
jgi:hypothetical protein